MSSIMMDDLARIKLANSERDVFLVHKSIGLTDADLIQAKGKEFMLVSTGDRQMGTMLIVFGVPMLLVFAGFIFIPIGIYLKKKAKKKAEMIRAGTEMYCKEVGVAYIPV